MKPESLHSLVIDHHLGELPPETADMLEHFLLLHPESASEARRIRQTLDIAAAAVERHPALGNITAPSPVRETPVSARPTVRLAHLAAAAAIAIVAGLCGLMAGRWHPPEVSSAASRAAGSIQAPSHVKSSPWARYRLVVNPIQGGMNVVRVHGDSTSHPSIQ